MKFVACLLALALGDAAPARRYVGVAEVPAPATAEAPVASVPGQLPKAAPAPVTSVRPPPPRPVAVDGPPALTPRRVVLQRVGVAAIVAGAAGYVAMIVGLGIGAAAESDLAPLRGRDEIDRRRDLVARGQLANRLALGASISGGIVLAVGIALVAVARRRGRPPRSQVALLPVTPR